MASRRDPGPVSSRFVTMKVAGAIRCSRSSIIHALTWETGERPLRESLRILERSRAAGIPRHTRVAAQQQRAAVLMLVRSHLALIEAAIGFIWSSAIGACLHDCWVTISSWLTNRSRKFR